MCGCVLLHFETCLKDCCSLIPDSFGKIMMSRLSHTKSGTASVCLINTIYSSNELHWLKCNCLSHSLQDTMIHENLEFLALYSTQNIMWLTWLRWSCSTALSLAPRTLRQFGWTISLQIEHSISMKLNLSSSSSSVSSLPASLHTTHTAVWGKTGCMDEERNKKRRIKSCW